MTGDYRLSRNKSSIQSLIRRGFVERLRRKVWRAISTGRQRLRIRKYAAISTLSIAGAPTVAQPLHAVGSGVLEINGRVVFGVFPSPRFFEGYSYVEARREGSRIIINDGTWINNGFVAIAEYSTIEIGRMCRIGMNVEIFDSDFHGLNPAERHMSLPEWNKPVKIGDNVFIGSNARILKGVTIGSGSVIANSAVVTRDIPPNVVAAGNPARIIRALL